MPAPPTLDRRRAASLHRQIYDEWRRGILAGRFAPGERVPSTRELAATLGVSRATVTAAYEQLIAEGYVDARHGAGTFVSGELPDGAIGGAARRRPREPESAARLSGSGRAVLILNDEDGRPVVRAALGLEPALLAELSGRPLPSADDGITRALDGAAHVAAAPLIVSGRVSGVLAVERSGR